MNYRNTHNAQQGNITPHMRGEVNQGHERSQCQRKSQALNTQSHHQNNYQHQAEYHSSNGSQQINGHTQQQAVNNVNNQQSEKRYMNLKSHGSRSAVEIAADKTAKGWNTIRLEAAAKLPTQDKKYDWNNKVSIQITKTELPCVVGVLLGYMKSCQFKNHGGDANKSFLIENQGKHFFFKVGQQSTQTLLPCPVPLVEAHLMGMLALSEYVKNFEGMTTDAALEAIKTMCGHIMRSGV